MNAALDAAYAACVDITRSEARNFYYGIRLLPAEKRSVLCAVYALARRIDDIGDGDLPAAEKHQRLAALRGQLARHEAADPVLAAVFDAAGRLPVPLAAFEELVDGVEMDLAGRRYETFDELVTYCRCVAGSVGRLCLGVFGSRPDPRAAEYADKLGIALQQTNILRDIREDLANGRVYLPQEDLDRFGVKLELDDDGRLIDRDGGLAALVRDSAERAQGWYEEGLRLVPLLDRRSAACCSAMAGIYAHLLGRIAADPTQVFDRRLSLSGRQKLGVAGRALLARSA
ncbi:MAG: squalene synthase HpnD [Mycobacterium sp.]|nr:squalene synthase HpnD [Mycobacterium sp.]